MGSLTQLKPNGRVQLASSLMILPAVFLICQLPMSAQWGQQQQQQQQQWPPPKKPYNNNNEYVAEHLKQPPDLPYLPPYGGHEPDYANILTWPKSKDGPCHTLTFYVKEQPSEVMAFYQQAVKNNGWELIPANCSDRMLAAKRSKPSAIFSVMVMNPVKKGYQCQVYMTYKIFGKE